MKNQVSLLLLLAILFFSISINAQTRFDLGLEFAPSLSKIHTSSQEDLQLLYPVNYGLRVGLRHNKFIYSSGILHIIQGSKLILDITIPNNPEGATGTGAFYIRAKSIMVPLNIEYIFKSTEKIEFSSGLGLYLGYIYSQQFENPFASQNQTGNIITINTPQQFTDINMFDDFYVGMNAGISMRVFFSEKLSLLLRPNYLYQIRKKIRI